MVSTVSSPAVLRFGLALLLVALLTACAAVTSSGDPNVAATVNGTEVPVSEVETRFEQAKQQPQVAQQLDADTEGVYAEQLQAQILSQLVVSELLQQWADDLGVDASEADIEQEREALIEQLGGQEAFEQAVTESGLTAEEVELQIRQRVLQNKISESVAGEVAVTDADIEAFYEENAAAQYGESAVARHILVDSRRQANDLIAELEDGADFAALAQEHSTDTGSGAQGGELPQFGRGQMVPEFEEAVFDGEIGEILGPVQTQFGFHIIEVLERNEGQPLEDVRGDIEQQLTEQQQNELLQAQLSERTQDAEVTVNPRFGTWNAETGQVDPTNPLGETRDTATEAPTGAPGGVPTELEPPVEAPTE
jgi:parvulin-like peptidyl-prolyl isomerase